MRASVLALALLAVAAPAFAQSSAVVTAVTAEELAAAVREAGTTFGVQINATTREAPDTSFVVMADIAFPASATGPADTLRFFVGLDSCEGTACGALSAVAFFGAGEGAPGPAELNGWNANRRLSRAYTTPEGIALQSDIDLFGGVTREAISRYLRTYLLSLVTFADALQGDDD